MEIWKEISGCDGRYLVSNKGRIKATVVGRRKKEGEFIFTKNVIKNNYITAKLTTKGGILSEKIHRLVAIAFIPNPENKPEVNHINGIRYDNDVKNLEWVTPSENIKHSYDFLGHKRPHLGKFGILNKASKPINQYDLKGNLVKTWDSMMDIQRLLGINVSNICNCCKERKDFKTAGGFIWKYKKD